MGGIEREVEARVTPDVPNSIEFIFEGWLCRTTFFVVIYATYALHGRLHQPPIVLDPLLEEIDVGATSHVDFIIRTLVVFFKSPISVHDWCELLGHL